MQLKIKEADEIMEQIYGKQWDILIRLNPVVGMIRVKEFIDALVIENDILKIKLKYSEERAAIILKYYHEFCRRGGV